MLFRSGAGIGQPRKVAVGGGVFAPMHSAALAGKYPRAAGPCSAIAACDGGFRGAQYDVAPDVWVGIRPQTPDDLPMIGAAGAANLFVNAGHGSLGWTLAAGSAEVLAEKIAAANLSA